MNWRDELQMGLSQGSGYNKCIQILFKLEDLVEAARDCLIHVSHERRGEALQRALEELEKE